MSHQNSTVENQLRPDELMAELDIKKQTYYDYLKHLGIKAEKDSKGRVYLTEAQANLIRQLRAHVSAGGKIEEFDSSHFESSGALVKPESVEIEAAESVPEVAVEVDLDLDEALDFDKLHRQASRIAAQRLTAGDQIILAMASQMGYDDLHPESKGKVDQVRAATDPKFNAQKIGHDLLSQYRHRQNGRSQLSAQSQPLSIS